MTVAAVESPPVLTWERRDYYDSHDGPAVECYRASAASGRYVVSSSGRRWTAVHYPGASVAEYLWTWNSREEAQERCERNEQTNSLTRQRS